MQRLTWGSQGRAIWEAAHRLQEEAIQVDVYLHTPAGGASGREGQGNSAVPRPPDRRKKPCKDFISFPAHRLILAAASPFLRKVLSEHYHDHRDACVDISLPHVPPEALHCILNYLYSGSTGVPPGITESVLEAATLLQINHFTDYYSSSIKLERQFNFKQENIALEENPKEPKMMTAEIPYTRKRKRPSGEQNVSSCLSKPTVQIKEVWTEQRTIGVLGALRKRRKAKSKYSSDIYEVNLPKMRKWKRKKIQRILKTEKKCSAKIQQLDVSQEPQKHTVPSLTIVEINEKSDQHELTNTGDIMKVQEDVICDPVSTPHPPPLTDVSSFPEKENNTPTPQHLLTIPSTSSTSVIMPPIHDQSYLSDSTIKTKTEEMLCPSVIIQDSVMISERPLERSMAIASPLLLSEVKELPLMSPPSSLASFPLKQETSLTHDHKISDPLHEDKNEEEEQEDGLFKFQVLLKECEDFPDEVCPVPHASQGSRGGAEKYRPGEGSVDINQWIAEEIHSCIIPTSSQCEVSTEESKNINEEEDITLEAKTSDSMADKNKSEVDCEQCGKQFSDHRSCQTHIRGVHDEAKQMCRYCGKMFRRRCDLHQHERRHRTATLPCKVHMRSVHTGERPFKCKFCDKAFCNTALLRNHQAVHTGEKKYSCSVCGRPFSQYSNMLSHQRTHTNTRPFLCLTCHEDFKTKEGLLKHRWVHTGLKPLRCCHCYREFRIKERYERHMLKCHSEVLSLPEIYLETPGDIVAREEGSSSPHCDIKVIGMTGKEEQFDDGTENHVLDGSLTDGGSSDDLGPVVHLVSNIAEQEVTVDESDNVLSYPLLTTTTALGEGSSITLRNITTQISCSGHVESIDVESLLHSEDSPNSEALIITGEGNSEVLPIIHEAVRDCEEVVILAKVSDTDEMSEEMHPQPTIKIWIPSEGTALERQDGEGDSTGDILIVSNQTFAETSQGQVLDPEMSPQVVHTMILEGSDASL
ncbi:Zinc finger protein 16 [Chionoecetes opilio]|uniref:Zinc finger protein 16 n=1 Tax=Chionoecetes opilio TaxID=41210 RepID=A0A8J5CNK6_CHIOP|nr:Zinc finger protein 16 [Chionoecetes opilio]